ncbi:MAG: tRNA pseudouridine(38-40) synthase TruA [Treponema sp. GWB1_62_6]|nr:MAG: tRNA pseudouridine(38-40) synthase TruA [Treponema sp. GWB1_62_6]OHE67877.1 MAG: tRNA pseudouridine(38-40) synthase TruA [Treponema sp. GWC1_61_84]OHE74679.1 MAG: tRNA pseudouridine(38-40) synthase TruA [Treponema sp. RIFOXYC1_FULL_61_9]HCM27270.1 tRNA pseudouridine(38-40) synthase TruA [Treponema sp.]
MTETRNIRLIVSYDGTDFSGWQRQENGRSVQEEIEKALGRIHKNKVQLFGSGRTDAGVHATGQVANFRTDIASIPPSNFVAALNGLLPRDVRILEARQASDDFHARFDAKTRLYRYFLICGRAALPHELRYAWQLWRRPDLSVLNSMAVGLIGETDCSTFATPKDPSESRHRYVSLARFHPDGDKLVFEIAANAFLYRMVRSVVGSLLHYEEAGADAAYFRRVVESRDRKMAGPTAPSQGLFLWKIDYYRD